MHGRVSGLLLALACAAPMAARAAVPTPRVDTLRIMAPGVSTAPLRVRIVVPERCRARACDTLYMDDGQDADAVQLVDTLAALEAAGAIDAPIVVAIDAPPDRMGAYGFSDRAGGHAVVAPTKYGDVGARAQAYATWLVHTLVPFVDARYRGRAAPAGRMLLGWSLGGAQAFDVAWQYPDVFAGAGSLVGGLSFDL